MNVEELATLMQDGFRLLHEDLSTQLRSTNERIDALHATTVAGLAQVDAWFVQVTRGSSR